MNKIVIEGKEYPLVKKTGYEVTKLGLGLDEADAMLNIFVATVKGIDEKTVKSLDPGPYFKACAEVQEFLGIRESDIKNLRGT